MLEDQLSCFKERDSVFDSLSQSALSFYFHQTQSSNSCQEIYIKIRSINSLGNHLNHLSLVLGFDTELGFDFDSND